MATRIGNKTSITLTGLDDLRRTLGDVAPNQARQIIRQAVHGIAAEVRDDLEDAVKKKSGDLGRSLKAVRRRGTVDAPVSEVRGGRDAPYMLMHEFGTSRTRAQPFIVPTVEKVRPTLKDKMAEEFAEKLKKALARQAKKAGG